MVRFIHILVCMLIVSTFCSAQEGVIISGTVVDIEDKKPITLVTVYLEESNVNTETDDLGKFTIQAPENQDFVIILSRIGYKESKHSFVGMPGGSRINLDVNLVVIGSDLEVVVRETRIDDAGMIKEGVAELKILPSTTGNFESVLPHIALGTSSGTGGELSSQYNVRGGNYDENLVYVNDFEIYRPQLIRAGQQEGLTFPNIDLIQSLSFSAGGFAAKYGDKLSSVLDIKYKLPTEFRASIGGSLLGGSAHIEGSTQLGPTKYNQLRYLIGARYKTTSYLLGSLDVSGEYAPDFLDLQGYFTYDISSDWQLSVLANLNKSVYKFKPEERSTALGLIDFALRLSANFDGQEVDDFTNSLGGVSLTYIPEKKSNPMFLKWLASSYLSVENERFDLIGAYRLSVIETNFGEEDLGEEVFTLGEGIQQEFTRNNLWANVTNFEHKGGIEFASNTSHEEVSHFLLWSVKYQYENISDNINEWERLDSAGYSLPADPQVVRVSNNLKSENELKSHRITAYFQDTYTKKTTDYRFQITGGFRAGYWTLNKEINISPRLQMLYKPLLWEKDVTWRIATGLYFQPPFYRELRRKDGSINRDLSAQKSWHVVGGLTWDFALGKVRQTPFRFIAEMYYKKLWDLVSYDIENVKIRYTGENDAIGSVIGLDLRLNGEFVSGAESWINLSFLRARENILDVDHKRREIGESEGQIVNRVPRPSDQLVSLSMFFQDYLPRNENFKVHVNFTFGTGLPFGLLDNNQVYRNTYRYDAYHRVDLGFSLLLWDEQKKREKPGHFLNFSRSAWISLEVFNMMGIQNVASNTWIKSIYNVQYAIPNYLTSRRVNFRVKFDF